MIKRTDKFTTQESTEHEPTPSPSLPPGSSPLSSGSRNGATAPDPFDLESLRLPQNFGAQLGVRKVLTTVSVRKPDRQWFIRVHPESRMTAAVVELKDESETYLVVPAMIPELPGEAVPKVLLLAVTREGKPFIWPIKLPDETGRLDEWNRSAMEAAKLAEAKWISIKADRHGGSYAVYEATGNFPEPTWPELPFKELLRIAFRDKLINTPDHPVILKLRGRQ